MDAVTTRIAEWYEAIAGNSWAWFNSLTREEWMIVLAVGATLGFLCMRGFGSRSKY